MTREDAIATLEESKRQNKIMIDNPTTFWASYQMADGVKSAKRRIEALDYALSALRPVSRAQVEKMYSDCSECSTCKPCIWNETKRCNDCHSMSLFKPFSNFCSKCGKPLTDEAVQMVMERMEALKDGKGD